MKNICPLLALLLLTAITLCLAACAHEENEWIPEIQGSHVEKMPYENIDGDYSVEKYTDFKSFKSSALADHNFNSFKTAKEERYSPEFFKTRDLAVIKFNKPDNAADYTVLDAYLDGDSCTVKLLAVNNNSYAEEKDATYCCFLETEKDISKWNISLETTEEISPENLFTFSYTDKHNQPYLFEGESSPVMFKITSPQGAEDFIENDPVLDRWNFISHILNSLCTEEIMENSDLLLIRYPSSELETLNAFTDNGSVEIVDVKTNHYMWSWDDNVDFSALIMMFVPKEFSPERARRTGYTEYEDDADNRPAVSEYALTETTAVTDNLTRYDFKESL